MWKVMTVFLALYIMIRHFEKPFSKKISRLQIEWS